MSRRGPWAPGPAAGRLLGGYCVAALATAAAVAAGGTRHLALGLAIIAVAVGCAATRMGIATGVATGGVGWLCYAGFIVGRHAELVWRGSGLAGWGSVATCLGAALAGGLAGAARARTARRREITGVGASQTRRYGENVVYLAAVRDRREVRHTSA
jgi:hypothetical protein